MVQTTASIRRVGATLTTVAVAVGLSATSGGTAVADDSSASRPTLMMPTGGGYEPETLEAFGAAAAERATGNTVDLVIVPSSYGDTPEDREENIALARERTAEVTAACNVVVKAPLTCRGRLAILLNRNDAMTPSRSAALRDPGLDGIYILGGDQGIAMDVLAQSPAETAMTAAVKRGVVLAGTSAGAAVESRSMINGYIGDYGPAQGLRKGSTLMWWGDDGDRQRGLAFGSQRAIYDQHFYQRGRFGRSLSTIATADERFGGSSPVGVGADYATGVRNTGDRTLSGVFGLSSVATLDYESLGATHSWIGTQRFLSARKVLTNLLTEGTSYDLVTRKMTRGGTLVGNVSGRAWTAPAAPGSGVLYLGGGVLGGIKVVPDFVATAKAANPAPGARLVILSGDTAATAASYAAKIRGAGWTGRIEQVTYGSPQWRALDLSGATAVAMVAVSPPQLAKAMSDSRFRDVVRSAVATTPAVLADGPVAAALGTWWSAKARPNGDNYEDLAVAAFRADDAHFQRGLGLVDVSVVPALNTDYQWGRLYGAVTKQHNQLALGVSAGSAVKLQGANATVVDGSVVVTDGRDGTFWTSRNGAFGAAGVVLDTFGPGEALHR